ncbi:MAG: GNAT family N-acetyltransferase [Myxococcales bacterium]|nr:GNAT family N-acetyltransferase [Myxococcales bacterium]
MSRTYTGAQIESFGLHQAPRLRALRLRALRDAPDAFETTFESAAGWPDDSWAQQLAALPTFVAVRDGADVGMVRGAMDEDRPDTAWLISMWVAPEARRHGVGGLLVDRVVLWARELELTRLLLDVGDANAAAIALYAGRGFERTGVTSRLPPPRDHIAEHQRELRLSTP